MKRTDIELKTKRNLGALDRLSKIHSEVWQLKGNAYITTEEYETLNGILEAAAERLP